MSAHVEAASGLVFHELNHAWGHGAPSLPGSDDGVRWRSVKHGQHGVMAHRMKMVLHTGTHMNAPIHLIQKGIGIGELPMEKLFGNGVILSVPKERWGLVTVEDLEAHKDRIFEGALVIIVTGWHHKYSDALEYFGESPGLSVEAAEWLVARKVGLVGMDTPQIDHPLATSLAENRGGPTMNRLTQLYKSETGKDPKAEHGVWNGAHKVLLAAEIPTIEQVGGDVDELLNKSALIHALPNWKFDGGDACPTRLVAITDPGGSYRIESGEGA